MRFDKRSSIPSCLKSIPDIRQLRPEHFLYDLHEVVSFVRRHPLLQRLPLFLLGHSEGVGFVLESAKESPADYAGVILLAGLGKYPIDETALRQLEAKINEAQTKEELLIARSRRAKAETNIRQTLTGLDQSSALASFQRIEEKVSQQEARAAALGELAQDTMEHRFQLLQQESDLDRQLAELKEKKGLAAGDSSKALGSGDKAP